MSGRESGRLYWGERHGKDAQIVTVVCCVMKLPRAMSILVKGYLKVRVPIFRRKPKVRMLAFLTRPPEVRMPIFPVWF
jgi:hypothetical protein